MKIERRDGTQERRILIGMITDRALLARISSKWDKEGLFKSQWGNLVGGWCVQFYKNYEDAPGSSIEGLYESWSAENSDKETARILDNFLSGLSGEYTRLRKNSNSQFLIDLAAKHFNQVKAVRTLEAAQGDLDAGDADAALKRMRDMTPLEMGDGHWVDVLKDTEAMRQAFKSKGKPLIQYPGALGDFFASAFERDALVAFMGPEKRGKCVAESTEVLLSDGRVRTIREIVEDKDSTPIVSYDEKTQRFVSAPISQFWDNGEKECWELITRTGRRVVTTVNHQYLTPDGWKEIKDISQGEFIAVPKNLPFFGTVPMPEAEVKFLAYMLAEGCCTGTSSSFTNADARTVADFKKACSDLGFPVRDNGIAYHPSKANPLIRKHGLFGHTARTKTIPDAVFKLPKEQLALFLRVFFTCDGSIHADGPKGNLRIELGLAGRKLLRQISHLLHRFGIVHRFAYKPTSYNGKRFAAWRISINCQEYVRKFLKEINFNSYKYTTPERSLIPHKSFLDKLPWQVADCLYQELKVEHGRGGFLKEFGRKSMKHVRRQICLKKPIMRQSFHHVRDSESSIRYLRSDVLWDEVVSLKPLGKRRTYDLGVAKLHNFVANDCIVHNSFWLLDVAWRGMLQGRKVAFIEVGDMTQNQIMLRFLTRASRRPLKPRTVKYPVSLVHDPNDTFAEVSHAVREFKRPLPLPKAQAACAAVLKKGRENLLRLSVYPNNSINLNGIKALLETSIRDGWSPDVIVIDYADLIAPMPGYTESRDQINATWKGLRALSQSLHCCVVTATQAKATSYKAETMDMSDFSEDKRKMAHVTAMFGINQTSPEKKMGLQRLNPIVFREEDTSEEMCVHVAGCLSLANPAVCSTF